MRDLLSEYLKDADEVKTSPTPVTLSLPNLKNKGGIALPKLKKVK